MLFKFFMLVDAGNVRLLEMGSTLSPWQRPLSCCFDCKGFLAVGLGRGKKRQCMRECREWEREKRGLPPFPFSHRSQCTLPIFKNFPQGASVQERRQHTHCITQGKIINPIIMLRILNLKSFVPAPTHHPSQLCLPSGQVKFIHKKF